MAVWMPDGAAWLTVPEAARLWNDAWEPMSARVYRTRCQRGEVQALGVIVSSGPNFLTDADSLLGYFERELAARRERLGAAASELRRERDRRSP